MGNRPSKSVSLLLSLENMHRLTARWLLLVLLAGTFAPLAGAVSMQSGNAHCVRKPMGTRAEGMPACHHHAAAVADQNAVAGPPSELAFLSRECCNGHQCCRSLVRSQWAQVRLHVLFEERDRAEDRVSTLLPQLRGLELAAYHSVRAPPTL